MIQNEFDLPANGTQLHVRAWKPEKPVVGLIVLVHGLGEHCGRYQNVADFFTREGFVMWGFDLRGHGLTPGPRGHIPSFKVAMDDIDAVLNRAVCENPGVPVFLYGHSMGGSIVLYYGFKRAAGRSLNGIIVTSPGLAVSVPVAPWKRAVAQTLVRVYPSLPFKNGLNAGNLSRKKEIGEAYLKDPFVHDKISASLGLDLFDKGDWMQNTTEAFPVPLLILQGSSDRVIDPASIEQFAKKIGKNCQVKIWEGGYHELHNGPDSIEVLNYISGWQKAHNPALPIL